MPTPSTRARFRAPSALLAIGAGALLAIAAPLSASAHVTVSPGAAEPGSFALITVKVPNESATESTTRVELTIPEATPFAFVSYVPVPGWTTELVTTTLSAPVETAHGEVTEAVTTVIWTAQPGSEIRDGQLQLFPLSVGPVPDVGSLVLPTDQTYSDGTVVSWSEEGEDAERPAPVLFVNDAPADHHHGDDGGNDAGDDPAAGPEVSSDAPEHSAQPDVLARVLGIAGLAVGAVGVVLALASRRKADTP
jgi:uncharacterized protein YcnI